MKHSIEQLLDMFFAPMQKVIECRRLFVSLAFCVVNGIAVGAFTNIVTTCLLQLLLDAKEDFIFGLIPYDHSITYFYIPAVCMYFFYWCFFIYYSYIKFKKRQKAIEIQVANIDPTMHYNFQLYHNTIEQDLLRGAGIPQHVINNQQDKNP